MLSSDHRLGIYSIFCNVQSFAGIFQANSHILQRGDIVSYQIQYPSVRKLRGREGTRVRLPLLTVLSFLIFLVMVALFWPEGTALIRNFVPVTALEAFASDLQHGEAVMASFSDFMRSLLHDSV